MQLLDITVRKDWEAIGAQSILENTRVWRWMLVAVVLAAGISVVAVLLPVLLPYRAYLQLVAAPMVPLIMAYAALARYSSNGRGSYRLVWLTYLVAFTLLVAASITTTRFFPPAQPSDTPLPLWFIGGLAVLNWWVVVWAYRRQPTRMRSVGFITAKWPVNVVAGGMIGAAFGLHLLFSIGVTTLPSWGEYVWVVVYLTGLRILSEEILFRGIGMYVLMQGMGLSLGQTLWRLALLSALVYAVPALVSASPLAALWYLGYGIVLSAVLAILRYKRGSLVPSFACNLMFGLFVLPVVI